MEKDFDSARGEIIERLKQRDIAFSIFTTGFTVILGVALQSNKYKLLAAIPAFALALSFQAIYHDGVIEYLHRYVRNNAEGWENSNERDMYSKSYVKWSYYLAQILMFAGGGLLSLILTYRYLGSNDTIFDFIWYINLIIVFIVFLLLILVRMWRHDKVLKNCKG